MNQVDRWRRSKKKRNEASGWILFKNLRCNFETSSRISNPSNIDLHQSLGLKGLERFSFCFKTSFKAWNVFLMTIAIQRIQIFVRKVRITGKCPKFTLRDLLTCASLFEKNSQKIVFARSSDGKWAFLLNKFWLESQQEKRRLRSCSRICGNVFERLHWNELGTALHASCSIHFQY